MTADAGEEVAHGTEATPTCPECEDHDQCARCGSSVSWEDCQACPMFGSFDEPDPHCPNCEGSGRVASCLSSYEWCQANPLPGCEDIDRHTVEWFTVPCPDCVEGLTTDA